MKHISLLLKLAVLILAFSSCIPRHKVVYFQTGSWDNPLDTAVATYQQSYSQYVLRPGDIINISLGSVTPVEFDFIAQYVVQMGEFLYLSPKTGKNGAQVFGSGGQTTLGSKSIESAYADKQALGFLVSKDGNLSLPRVGDVYAAGKTLNELELELESKLNGFFETPKVRIQLLNFQFTVLGEVKQEGHFTTFNEKTPLLEAITMAGNCTEYADRSQVKVIRTQNGKTSVIYVNLLDAAFFSSPYMYLYPDDVVVIAPLPAKFWRLYVLPDSFKALTYIASALSIILLTTRFQ